MKFSHYLEQLENFEWYPLVSLFIFAVIFIIVLIYAFTADQKKMEHNADIPLK